VIAHRVLFAPSFLAVSRRLAREEVVAQLFARCLELAPRPAPPRS
jgi:hypothetical protein